MDTLLPPELVEAARRMIEANRAAGRRIAVAESCTGGLVSAALTELFIREVDARCPELQLGSPREPAQRGSQISFTHPHAYPIMQALIARGIIGDFRAPDLVRFGSAPLYNRFEDAWRAAAALAEIITTREWDQPQFHARQKVT